MALIRKKTDPTAPSTPVFGAALHSLSADERWAAARALGGAPANVPLLAAALSTETSPRVLEAILTGLARAETDEAAEAIVALVRSDEANDRTLALDALKTMPAVIERKLPDLVRDQDPDVRILASDLARVLPPALATRILSDLLSAEADPNVCAAAVDVLAERGTSEAVSALAICKERFPTDPFLGFAIDTAISRIGTDSPGA